jgi:hypothetical protein
MTSFTRTTPPDLAARGAAVVELFSPRGESVAFNGRYDECLVYLKQQLPEVIRGLLDLRYAEYDSATGLIELGRYASFVLD